MQWAPLYQRMAWSCPGGANFDSGVQCEERAGSDAGRQVEDAFVGGAPHKHISRGP